MVRFFGLISYTLLVNSTIYSTTDVMNTHFVRKMPMSFETYTEVMDRVLIDITHIELLLSIKMA